MQAARGASLTSSDQSGGTRHRPRRLRLLFAAVALTAYGIDLATKQWAVRVLPGGDIHVFGDWFVLHLTFNPGAAFSTGTQFTMALSFLAIAAVLAVLWFSRRLGSLGWALGLGLLLGGVSGNLTDRIFRDPGPMRGHVVDLFMLPNWPVFNVADICINVAAGVIILQTLRGVSLDGSRAAEDPA